MKPLPVFTFLLFFLYIPSACNDEDPYLRDMESQRSTTGTTDKIRINTLHRTDHDTTVFNARILAADSLTDFDPDSSRIQLYSMLEESIEGGYTEGIYKSLTALGKTHLATGHYDSALLYFRQALDYTRQFPPGPVLTAICYNNMGVAYYKMSRFDTAALLMYRSLNELERYPVSDYKRAARIYLNSAAFWIVVGNYEIVPGYVDKASEYALMAGDSASWLEAQTLNANILAQKQQYDSAARTYQLILDNSATPPQLQITVSVNTGNMLMKQKRYQEALPYYEEAYRLSQDSRNEAQKLDVYFHLGTIYYYNQEFQKAGRIFKEVIKKAPVVGLPANHANAYFYLAAIQTTTGAYESAYWNQNTAIKMKDSIFKKEKVQMMNKLEVQYRIAEKDRELATRKLEISRQRLWILSIGAGALLLISILLGVLRSRRQKAEIARLRDIMQGEEKERMRMARELHDGIVSQLSAVKLNFSSIAGNQPENSQSEGFREALAQLEQSIRELRTTSHNLLPEILKQEGLIGAIRLFCEKTSKVTSVHIDFQLVGTLPAISAELELGIYRILQELVHNIIKHADATEALVQVVAKEDWISITIDDNGRGIPEDQPGAAEGIGLQNLRERLKSLNGTMDIRTDNGTSVYLDFNLKKDRGH